MEGPLTPVPDALSRVLAGIGRTPSIRAPLGVAAGRVTTAAVTSPVDLPRFDNSAMDGFAVRASDTTAATPGQPVHLTVVDAVGAGASSPPAISPGTAVRIATGAPLPDGADAILRREATREQHTTIHLHSPLSPGQDIRRRGEDVHEGDELVPVGTRLTPAGLTALAAAGLAEVEVHAPARVAIVATGDEIVAAGATPSANRIPDAVGPALRAWCGALGAVATIHGPVPDHPEELASALHELAGRVDVLVTIGGVSVGHRDHLRSVIGDVALWGVALQPGKPFAFGTLDGTPWFGLPGNPVAALATFSLFVEPALRRLHGREPPDEGAAARLAAEASPHPDRWRVLPARWVLAEGMRAVDPLPSRGSAAVRYLGRAEAFIVLTPGERPLPRGTEVAVRTLPVGFCDGPG